MRSKRICRLILINDNDMLTITIFTWTNGGVKIFNCGEFKK